MDYLEHAVLLAHVLPCHGITISFRHMQTSNFHDQIEKENLSIFDSNINFSVSNLKEFSDNHFCLAQQSLMAKGISFIFAPMEYKLLALLQINTINKEVYRNVHIFQLYMYYE